MKKEKDKDYVSSYQLGMLMGLCKIAVKSYKYNEQRGLPQKYTKYEYETLKDFIITARKELNKRNKKNMRKN